MGLVKFSEASWVLNAIEKTLEDLNLRTFDATATKIFMKKYFG